LVAVGVLPGSRNTGRIRAGSAHAALDLIAELGGGTVVAYPEPAASGSST
jgi:hypothetical protein